MGGIGTNDYRNPNGFGAFLVPKKDIVPDLFGLFGSWPADRNHPFVLEFESAWLRRGAETEELHPGIN